MCKEGYLWTFWAFDFCRFCVVIRFFIPATTANDSDFEGFLYQILYITFEMKTIKE